tara:strand:+ start:110 stop:880 length:771 start_codon:yes stop_codon:yes gene_type:complete
MVNATWNRIKNSAENLISQTNEELYEEAIREQGEANLKVKKQFHDYISEQSTDKKKLLYKLLNVKATNKYLDTQYKKYTNELNLLKDNIIIYNIINKNENKNLNANEFYRLKNMDIKNKLDDINGTKQTNRRKAFYQNDYINYVKYYKSNVQGIYFILALIYLLLMFKKQKYKDKRYWGIFICILIYPFVINYIMLNVIKVMEKIFRYTPVNTYRNLYSQDINQSTSSDNNINVHYTHVRQSNNEPNELSYSHAED